MTQSPRMSMAEVGTNYAIGISVSWLLSWYVLPYWGFEQSVGSATAVTAIYTVTSIIRAYAIRRTFNWIGR